MSLTANFKDIKEFLIALRPNGLMYEKHLVANAPKTKQYIDRLQSVIVGLLLKNKFAPKNLKGVAEILKEVSKSDEQIGEEIKTPVGKVIEKGGTKYLFSISRNDIDQIDEWFYKRSIDGGKTWSPEIFIDAGTLEDLKGMGFIFMFDKREVWYMA